MKVYYCLQKKPRIRGFFCLVETIQFAVYPVMLIVQIDLLKFLLKRT
ncbi:MAG: hypothetical protein H6Q19_905 [Bacteroidetes bacterium]|nr:hypothetical protein [Bacteroidota bacterium]